MVMKPRTIAKIKGVTMEFLEIDDDVYINTSRISKISFDNQCALVEVDCKSNYEVDDHYYVRQIRSFVNRNEWTG